MKLINNDLFVV